MNLKFMSAKHRAIQGVNFWNVWREKKQKSNSIFFGWSDFRSA